MSERGKPEAAGDGRIPFGGAWLNKPVVLAVLIVFAVLLCAFLNRCYAAMPWDEWTIAGIPAAQWRKPVAAALFSVSVWGVSICSGCLFWWLVSWVSGAGWSAGLRRVWENWANAGWGAWIMLAATSGMMMTVLFPWADNERHAAPAVAGNVWFFNSHAFLVRELVYFLVMTVLAMVVRSSSTKSDLADAAGYARYRKNMLLLSALGLPLVVVAMGMMGIDWIGGLEQGPVLSMWPLYTVAYMAVAGLAASTATAAAAYRYRDGAGTGLEQGHLGALLLVALLFKAYFGYSQFLIVMYGGMPGEELFYGARLVGGWYRVAQWCAVAGVLLPALCLLVPSVRRSPGCLLFAGCWVLVCSLVEAGWMVAPALDLAPGSAMLLQAFAAGFLVLSVLLLMSLLSSMSHGRSFAVDPDRKLP